jgi:hypothetical protein
MKRIVLLSVILFSTLANAQINFEEGYIISSSNEKSTVFIKNVEWKDNPVSFEYRMGENGEITTGTLNSVKEFGINGDSRYVNTTVNIDKSSDNTSQLSYNKNPEFQKETLFLKVLIDSKASLYSYEEGNLTRFFYKIENNPIEPLVFKNYKITNFQAGKNEQYKQQLYNTLKCESISLDDVENLEYQKSELLKFFIKYNECENSELVNFEANKSTYIFHLSIRPGVNSASASLENKLDKNRDVTFDNETNFRLGLEAEVILPFNKGKWAVLFEPTYQSYKSQKIVDGQNIEIDYRSIEFPLGVRHYFFLTDKSKLFLNASYVIDANLSSTIIYESDIDLEIKSSSNAAVGFGYNYNNKVSLEFRYQSPRGLLVDYNFYRTQYSSISLILGYSLF